MKKTITIILFLCIILLSGCIGSEGKQFEEIVEVQEVKTEIDKDGFVHYYFKSNSSVTSDWIHALNRHSWGLRRRLVVQTGDLLIVVWRNSTAGITIVNVKKV